MTARNAFKSVQIQIIDIFSALKYNDLKTSDWLQLERDLKAAKEWKLKEVERCIVQKFIANVNEENCIAVWRLCARYMPEEAKKVSVDLPGIECRTLVFEYVLYTVNETVVSGRNLDFFRLKHEHLYEILDADLLNVDNELEVWLLLRRWILADRKNRLRLFRKLIKSVRYYQLNDKQVRFY
ncbi:unnamed protein product [Gongylonema pulchrum]|uniref:BACK domain-containing protein n=1 Tax=Gongylonema pulchrum TaxID=637853 RepID=A0A183ENW6_9BILA|nr:unnamed protein product [Gongylonema pulchrum]